MAREERTEAPTPKRKRDARRKGQIAKSQDLVTWVQILIATFAIPSTVTLALGALRTSMIEAGRFTANPETNRAAALLGTSLRSGLLALTPLVAAMLASAVVTSVAQTGFAITPRKLKPTTERISPMKGFKRLFSKQGAWEATKEAARAGVLAYVAWGPLTTVTRTLIAERSTMAQSVSTVAASSVHLARSVAYAGIAMGALDYAVQKRRLMKSLKMTKQEVKDEYRQTEGDPHVKSQFRQRAQEISRNRMMSNVKRATAVVVNPTHVAVAILYERSVGAPVVLAKGTGAIAARIREEAETHRIPVVRNVALARALNAVCEIDEQIPASLYEAVARLLAFVMALGNKPSYGGPLTMTGPTLLPPELLELAQVEPGAADRSTGARKAPKRRGQGRPRRDEVQ